jgi:hypothetical protein
VTKRNSFWLISKNANELIGSWQCFNSCLENLMPNVNCEWWFGTVAAEYSSCLHYGTCRSIRSEGMREIKEKIKSLARIDSFWDNIWSLILRNMKHVCQTSESRIRKKITRMKLSRPVLIHYSLFLRWFLRNAVSGPRPSRFLGSVRTIFCC